MIGHRPWSLERLGLYGGAVIGYVVHTFIYYWWHRARHTVPFAGGSPIFGTSLAMLFSHRLGSQDEGGNMALAAFRRQLNEYMHRLEVAGMPERRYRLPAHIQAVLDPPKN